MILNYFLVHKIIHLSNGYLYKRFVNVGKFFNFSYLLSILSFLGFASYVFDDKIVIIS